MLNSSKLVVCTAGISRARFVSREAVEVIWVARWWTSVVGKSGGGMEEEEEESRAKLDCTLEFDERARVPPTMVPAIWVRFPPVLSRRLSIPTCIGRT